MILLADLEQLFWVVESTEKLKFLHQVYFLRSNAEAWDCTTLPPSPQKLYNKTIINKSVRHKTINQGCEVNVTCTFDCRSNKPRQVEMASKTWNNNFLFSFSLKIFTRKREINGCGQYLVSKWIYMHILNTSLFFLTWYPYSLRLK